MVQDNTVTPLKPEQGARDAASPSGQPLPEAMRELISRRTVRVRERRDDGFVEFDFSIGDPRLFVELILPESAFNEFCAANSVRELSADEARVIDDYIDRWVAPGFDDEPDSGSRAS